MTIKETADKLAAEYAAQYDDGKWREYAEEDFYAGFMAAIEYLKTEECQTEHTSEGL